MKHLCLRILLLNILAVPVTTNGLQAQQMNAKPDSITCPGNQLPYPRPEPDYTGKRERDFSPFDEALKKFSAHSARVEKLVKGKDIRAIQVLLRQQLLKSEDLVLYYLERIRRYDNGKLNSVMELNPDVLTVARQKDAERLSGKGGSGMHGIPVLLKDNIATFDRLHTTAGAAALLSWRPHRDAFLVKKLREAGAVILGKANLSEWANYMDPCMPSGFSANGGQTRNPYGAFETWGSSSGSAVAVAADLVTVSVGSETQGSVIMPAGINSVVGLKTSMGLVSRDMIIPLLDFQDVPGPMGRTVTDVAFMLSAMTGYDEKDKTTKKTTSLHGVDFTQYLKPTFFKSLKVAVPSFSEEDLQKAIDELEKKTDSGSLLAKTQINKLLIINRQDKKWITDAGLVYIPIPFDALPPGLEVEQALEYGFREDLNAFFKKLGVNAPYPNLEAIIAYNNQDLKNRSPYGQGYLVAAQNSIIPRARFDSIRESNKSRARAGIDSILKKYGADAIMHNLGQTYAPAGYPALSIPAGYNDKGQPEDIVLVGTFLSEPRLLAIGYAMEQMMKARKEPDLEAVMKLIDK